MLLQRKNLYEQAQERVHEEGFAYKKGKSRCVYMYCIECVCVSPQCLHWNSFAVVSSHA